MGLVLGTLVAVAALQLAKLSGDVLSEKFVTLMAFLGMLVGTGIGAVLFSDSGSSTVIWVTMVCSCGALLVGYAARYHTHLDFRKHPERYTE
jgi:hypothetical protein